MPLPPPVTMLASRPVALTVDTSPTGRLGRTPGVGGRRGTVVGVDVWVAPLDVGSERLRPLVASLSPAERARAGRYRFPGDARRFSAARGWLRHVLGAELGVDPAAVPLSEGPGKPRLAGGEGLRFNVSHARDLALIAVAACEVGVDVEHARDGPPGLDAVRLCCTPAEADAIERMPPGERADAFLRRWTAKEAYLKARGLGLAVPPDRVEIGAARAGGAVPVGVTGEPGPARWKVRELRPAPGYVGAVAAAGSDWDFRLQPVTGTPVEA